METIIGLLFILLPVIFNLIGKRLEKSGKQETAARMREIAKSLGGDDEDQDDVGQQSPVVPPTPVYVAPKPVAPKPVAPKPVAPAMENVKRATVKPKKVLLEETKPEKREKIDPKKLVIYSEIMKPKYTE